MNFITMRDIKYLCLLDSRARDTMHSHLIHTFHSILHRRFGLNGDTFRGTLRHLGGIIYSDFALGFLIRKSVKRAPMKVLLREGTLQAMSAFLRDCGYEDGGLTMEEETDQIYLNVLYNLRSLMRLRKGDAVVELAEMQEGDHIALLASAGTTAHMTYLTADSIHTVFPDLTFSGRAIRMKSERMGSEEDTSPWIQDQDVRAGPCRDLLDLGFEVAQRYCWEGACGSGCAVLQRSLRDPHCFHFVFDEEGYDRGGHGEQGFQGGDVHFRVGDACFNVACPMAGRRW